nr:hypothetical protein [Tanacetum cinerariifolium]
SPRLSKEFISENSDTALESFSPSPIPIEDSDSLIEEIDLSFTPDDSMSPGIKEDDYDSEKDILSLKNCLAIIPFHFLKMSHFILIFLHPLILLQNHRMEHSNLGCSISPFLSPLPRSNTPIIAPIIPPSPDYTPASPDYSPVSKAESDPSEDPSLGHIPPLPANSPVLSSDDDTTDSDTPDTPPSPTYDTPFTEITASTQRSPPIPHGRPYRYHLNGPLHMMTARKRVRPLPVQQLSSTSTGPSHKRRRSPMTSVPALPFVSGALSLVRANLIPLPKRVRDIGYLEDVEDDPRKTRVERVVHPAMPEDIPEPTQEGAVEVTYETLGDLIQRVHDHTQAIPVHHIQTTEGI